jgi:REP element-mobilizing transposase RayT
MNLRSKDKDYEAFETLLAATWQSRRGRICACCLLPNHRPFLLWPEPDGDLAAFMRRPEPVSEARRTACPRLRVGLRSCTVSWNPRLVRSPG